MLPAKAHVAAGVLICVLQRLLTDQDTLGILVPHVRRGLFGLDNSGDLRLLAHEAFLTRGDHRADRGQGIDNRVRLNGSARVIHGSLLGEAVFDAAIDFLDPLHVLLHEVGLGLGVALLHGYWLGG